MFENYFVKCTKALTAIPLFHGECDNFTNAQQRLQLFIKYSKFFRGTILIHFFRTLRAFFYFLK